ncbi:MAG: PEGA domain-containing protein [bacterium]
MHKKYFLLASLMLLLLAGCGMPKETLKAVGNEGLLKIIAEPSSAEVYVDGNFVGKAKEFNGNPGLLKLSHGTHVIMLKKKGYQTYIRRVFVGNEAIEPINIMLIKEQ